MDTDIIFAHDGRTYRVAYDAYRLNRIVMPDGTVLESRDGWLESMPPIPAGELTPVQHLFSSFSVEEIARYVNGVVATLLE